MKRSKLFAAAVVSMVAVATGPASAGDRFAERMTSCIRQHVSAQQAAVVMLECNADAGKLSGCKVVENSAAGKGFDRAAICVADALPMGSKSGLIRVPMRFPKPA